LSFVVSFELGVSASGVVASAFPLLASGTVHGDDKKFMTFFIDYNEIHRLCVFELLEKYKEKIQEPQQ